MCIREAEEYARNAAAMTAFFKKSVATDSQVLSPLCDAATLAKIEAKIDNYSDECLRTNPCEKPTSRPKRGLLYSRPGVTLKLPDQLLLYIDEIEE